MHPHIASAVLMAEPTTFGFGEQTAVTNAFQHHLPQTTAEVTRAALHEFAEFVATLKARGITVLSFRAQSEEPKPDAVFPNNWLTTWPDGTVYIYLMAVPARRRERSPAVIKFLRGSFQAGNVVDLSEAEQNDAFLEGTGAMVFDHLNRRVFGCISPRCDARLFTAHAGQLGYEPVLFHASDPVGVPIYHTNVLMGIQPKTAVIYAAGIASQEERRRVLQLLVVGGRTIIDITFAQLQHFCGNLLTVQNKDPRNFVVLSRSAYDAFTPEQRRLLSRNGELLPVAIPTIEAVGGGSARCMLAEIFLLAVQ